ncbi:MAG: hypothetical protein WD669_05885 [Pirellulales bacterium]
MTYWLDLFTGTTWDEFRKAGETTTGFREKQRTRSSRVKPGDIFLCYLTGVMRWIGALEVIGPSDDTRPIWSLDFPVRFEVKPLIVLDPECGIPMETLKGRVSFYVDDSDRGKYKGIIRGSPNRFQQDADGGLVFELLRDAQRTPVRRPVDAKKLARAPFFRAEQRKGKQTVSTVVSIPEPDEVDELQRVESPVSESDATSLHTRIQHELLSLGADMGFDVWVARNDRSKQCNGQTLGAMPKITIELPTQFNEATNATIELIDVLWLKGNSIVAAFEVECTTAVYSGLLRMSDLLALQPNLDIKLYLVAPDERRGKVEREILRPTFKLREKPLHQVCGFLAFSSFTEKVEGIRRLGLAASLKPDFLEQTAEFFETTTEED